jgi:hypothetical protein
MEVHDDIFNRRLIDRKKYGIDKEAIQDAKYRGIIKKEEEAEENPENPCPSCKNEVDDINRAIRLNQYVVELIDQKNQKHLYYHSECWRHKLAEEEEKKSK